MLAIVQENLVDEHHQHWNMTDIEYSNFYFTTAIVIMNGETNSKVKI